MGNFGSDEDDEPDAKAAQQAAVAELSLVDAKSLAEKFQHAHLTSKLVELGGTPGSTLRNEIMEGQVSVLIPGCDGLHFSNILQHPSIRDLYMNTDTGAMFTGAHTLLSCAIPT
eukprot:COSAG02_NODE_2173_length_9590_cov_39.075229_2_plen_114_part_00